MINAERASASYLVWVDGKARLLVDIGGGAFLRFGQSRARLADLSLVAISHLHPDHVSDLPALLWLSSFSRREPLPIVGPSGNQAAPDFPEFLGRLPIISVLDPLTEDDLVRILTEPRDAIVKQYQEFFRLNDSKLTFTEKALRDMAKLATERGTGARGLRAIIENVMLDVLYEYPEHVKEIGEYVVTPELVRHRMFAKGKKVLRKPEGRRETA